MKRVIAVVAFAVIALGPFYIFADEYAADAGEALINVDSEAPMAEISVTAKRGPVEADGLSREQSRLITKRSAVAEAYEKLLLAVKDVPPAFFPKDRYLLENGYIHGARLIEAHYYGDGSVEVELGVELALEPALIEIFEKDMRLLGYRVIERDSLKCEITEEEWRKTIKPPTASERQSQNAYPVREE